MSLLALLAAGQVAPPPSGDGLTRYRAALAAVGTEPLVIAVAGDSLTDGDATTIDSTGWSSVLTRALRDLHSIPATFYDTGATDLGLTPTSPGLHMVNTATSGTASYSYLGTGGWNQANIVRARADLVCHMVGINNYSFTSYYTAPGVANDIASRIDLLDTNLVAAGAPQPSHLVLVEPGPTGKAIKDPPPFTWAEYRTELTRIVNDRPNCTLVDVDAAFSDRDGLKGSDGIHLTAAGYQAVADAVMAAIG